MLEYNISQPYELVNPWDICDWKFFIDKRDDIPMKLGSIVVNDIFQSQSKELNY